MALEMNLLATVKPGQVTTNFDQFKDLVRKELEENYKSIVVSEESLKEAKAARASLNKAKESLKETMRSATAQNDEPLKVARVQAKELEAILDDAILTLDRQIKDIENKQREQRIQKAENVLASTMSRLETDEMIAFAAECDWIRQKSWGNATTSFLQIKSDCDKAKALIEQAFALLEGDFRPQMLAEFKRTGDLTGAQMLGRKLQKERDDYEAAQLAKAQAAQATAQAPAPTPAPAPAPELPKKEIKEEPIQEEQGIEVITVRLPESFIRDERSRKRCHADFRVVGARFQLEWLLDTCKGFGIELTRLDKQEA